MGRHRTDEEKAELGERARAMRAAGTPRREIIATLRIGDDLATELLRGCELPDSLRRPRAKDHLRQRARELREAGWTYPKIAAELGVSKSSCSLWLRDMDHPDPSVEGQERRTAALRASSARRQRVRAAERELVVGAVAESLGEITSRDLIVALAVSYWCEGAKAKPWNPTEYVAWMNSDPVLVRLFLEGLRLLGVEESSIGLRVQIHESADEVDARLWWANELGWDPDRFSRTTFKRHNPKTVRKNCGDGYHGCLTVRVLKSRSLYRALNGLVVGLAERPRALEPI